LILSGGHDACQRLFTRLTLASIIAAGIIIAVIVDSFFTPYPAITFTWILVGIIIGYPFGV